MIEGSTFSTSLLILIFIFYYGHPRGSTFDITTSTTNNRAKGEYLAVSYDNTCTVEDMSYMLGYCSVL